MGNWISRDLRQKQKHLNRSFSKPFKKKLEKDSNVKERRRIREAQRAKHDSMEEEDDQFDE